MKKSAFSIAVVCLAILGCQARPQSDRRVQIKPNEFGKAEPQSLTPIPLLASERILQSMALAKLLMEGLLEDKVPKIEECESWSPVPNQVKFSKCKKDNIDFSGVATLKSAAGNEIKEFKFEVIVSEKDGNRLETASTRLETAITGVNLERDQDGAKAYSASVRMLERGRDQGRDRMFEATGSDLRFTLSKGRLTSFTLGGLNVKLQRDKKKLNGSLFIESDDLISHDGRFWKGALVTMDSVTNRANSREVAFAEGMISLTEDKGAAAVSVECLSSTAELNSPVKLRCLAANLHQTGPGRK